MQSNGATIVSIHVGKPAQHGPDAISDKPWESGIVKQPVTGKIWLDTLNLEGDGQHDLKNHGGPFRAVLGYSADHYPIWREELAYPDLSYGNFGENFTISGLEESTVCLGDVYAVGESVRLQIAQPRYPCWKLARRNGIKDLTARTEQKGWGGWYHRVLQTGYVQAGDAYTLIERPYPQYTIALLNDLVTGRRVDADLCRALSAIEELSTDWRVKMQRLSEHTLSEDAGS